MGGFARRRGIAFAVVVLLAALAAKRIGFQSYRLLAAPAYPAAIDLQLRLNETRHWIRGEPVYGALVAAVYPPATYALFAPLALVPEVVARGVWWLLVMASLVALSILTLRAIQDLPWAADRRWRAAAALLPWAAYPASIVLSMGQVGLLSLTLAIVAVILAVQASRARQVAAGGLFAVALVKPSVAAPFFWLLLWLWPPLGALVAAGSYLALSLMSMLPRPERAAFLLVAWVRQGAITLGKGYGHLAILLGDFGATRWSTLAALLLLLALGAWTWRRRDADIWARLGVAAVCARIWTYHTYSDDLLALPCVIAVLRLAAGAPTARRRQVAAIVAGVEIAVLLLAPTRLFAATDPHVRWLVELPGTAGLLLCGATIVALAARGVGGRAIPQSRATAAPARSPVPQ
jgi:hypothetical protein